MRPVPFRVNSCITSIALRALRQLHNIIVHLITPLVM